MRTIVAIVLILAGLLTSADARRRHRNYQYVSPPAQPIDPSVLARDRRSYAAPRGARDAPPPSVPSQGSAELIPTRWQRQPDDPNWQGQRYRSPDGSAWLSLYARPADGERIAAEMKAFAFVDGEEIISISAERDWIAVWGSKGEKMFYRKAVLSCGGQSWHNLAFEYPAEARASMDAVASRSARALDNTRNDGCQAEQRAE
jgi:serine/threonine-protein kinase